jgi:hypothetical protein
VIQNTIEDELAERLLAGKLKAGGFVKVDREGDEVKIETTETPDAPPPPAEPQPELAGSTS